MNVWDVLADSWANLRTQPEREVINFAQKIKKGPILDIGCGNHRNALPFLKKNLFCIGIDSSKGMIREAKKFLNRRKFRSVLIIGDMCSMPFKNSSFHAVLCLRTLHHVETRKLRQQSLREMSRIGDKIIISVWKRWQRRFIWSLIKSLIRGNFGDIYVNWNYHGNIYKRFYHLYTKKELENDLKEVNLKIEKMWNDEKGNIFVECKRVKRI